MDDKMFMKMALDAAREGVQQGQTPFGACVVLEGKVVACEHNKVWQDTDITAHAEVVAIREACRALGKVDLSGCTIYATTEPCPMCFSAIHWARIGRIVYGAGIDDARAAGFNELGICNREMRDRGGCDIEILGGVMRDECLGLFAEFRAKPGRRTY